MNLQKALRNLKDYLNQLSEEELSEIRENYLREWGIEPDEITCGDDVYDILYNADYDLIDAAADNLTLEEYVFWWRK